MSSSEGQVVRQARGKAAAGGLTAHVKTHTHTCTLAHTGPGVKEPKLHGETASGSFTRDLHGAWRLDLHHITPCLAPRADSDIHTYSKHHVSASGSSNLIWIYSLWFVSLCSWLFFRWFTHFNWFTRFVWTRGWFSHDSLTLIYLNDPFVFVSFFYFLFWHLNLFFTGFFYFDPLIILIISSHVWVFTRFIFLHMWSWHAIRLCLHDSFDHWTKWFIFLQMWFIYSYMIHPNYWLNYSFSLHVIHLNIWLNESFFFTCSLHVICLFSHDSFINNFY